MAGTTAARYGLGSAAAGGSVIMRTASLASSSRSSSHSVNAPIGGEHRRLVGIGELGLERAEDAAAAIAFAEIAAGDGERDRRARATAQRPRRRGG